MSILRKVREIPSNNVSPSRSVSSSIKIKGGRRRGRSDKGVMLKCLAAASRRNLSCEGEAATSSCCELLLTKFGTTEPDVIKEIFKKRIQAGNSIEMFDLASAENWLEYFLEVNNKEKTKVYILKESCAMRPKSTLI